MDISQKFDKKYKKSLKELVKKLEIFEDNLDKKYQILSLLKVGNRKGVFYNLCQKLKSEIEFEILSKNQKNHFLRKIAIEYAIDLIEEKMLICIIQFNSNDILKFQFIGSENSAKIVQKKIASDSILLKNLQQKIQNLCLDLESAPFSLILNDISKKIFSIHQQVSRQCFYFTQQAILDIKTQIYQKKKEAANNNQKEKIKEAQKFLKKLKEDQFLNEKNLEYVLSLPVLKKFDSIIDEKKDPNFFSKKIMSN
jgi:hypothetical protein